MLGNALELASHNAPLNPGGSDGPLLSIEGEVLGVNVASSKLEGVFYAVPYSEIKADVLSWKARLVVLPTPTPTVLEQADMWVLLEQHEDYSQWVSAKVDVTFDVGEYELTVFAGLYAF